MPAVGAGSSCYDAGMRAAATKLVGPACAATLLLAGLTGCGDDTKLPQAPSASAVLDQRSGDHPAGQRRRHHRHRDGDFKLDDSRSLVAHLAVRSQRDFDDRGQHPRLALRSPARSRRRCQRRPGQHPPGQPPRRSSSTGRPRWGPSPRPHSSRPPSRPRPECCLWVREGPSGPPCAALRRST